MPMPIATSPLARARLPLAAAACLAALGVAAPARAMLHYDGLAYAPNGQQLLYRESHWVRDDGARLVLYRCADGSAFARKRIADGSIAPDFELVDARSGYREGVRHAGKGRVMFSQRDGQPERSAPLPATAAPQVIDAGFDAYLRLHWDALGQGTPQRVAFVLPSALRTLDFQIKPAAADAGVQRYTLAVDAWYGGVLPNIAVAYTRGDRRLLEFRGIGNVRDARGRYAQVRIEFPERLRGQADDDAWNQAVQQPLVAQCAAR
jgi:hypothetical protein